MFYILFRGQGRICSQQGPVQKTCGALQLGRHTLFFLDKKLATFFIHHRPCALFCGDPCSAEHAEHA